MGGCLVLLVAFGVLTLISGYVDRPPWRYGWSPVVRPPTSNEAAPDSIALTEQAVAAVEAEKKAVNEQQELLEKMDALSSLLSELPLRKALFLLERAATLDPSLNARVEQLKNGKLEIEELSSHLHSYTSRLDADPLQLTKIEERMAAIEQLKRRFGKTTRQFGTLLSRPRLIQQRITIAVKIISTIKNMI